MFLCFSQPQFLFVVFFFWVGSDESTPRLTSASVGANWLSSKGLGNDCKKHTDAIYRCQQQQHTRILAKQLDESSSS